MKDNWNKRDEYVMMSIHLAEDTEQNNFSEWFCLYQIVHQQFLLVYE